jgi:hypothetical protein
MASPKGVRAVYRNRLCRCRAPFICVPKANAVLLLAGKDQEFALDLYHYAQC